MRLYYRVRLLDMVRLYDRVRLYFRVRLCAAHYQNVCDVRAGVAENPRTLTHTKLTIGVVDAPPDKTTKILSIGCYQCRHNSLEEKRC